MNISLPSGPSRALVVLSTLLIVTGLITACAGGDDFNPELFGDDPMVPAAEIYAAHQNDANIVFVDARPELDYEFGHIPGARSVPYFEAEEHVDNLPRDQWIVTYCECPHAEAQQVADVLIENGFEYVKVMGDGLPGWREAGGPEVAGTPSGSAAEGG